MDRVDVLMRESRPAQVAAAFEGVIGDGCSDWSATSRRAKKAGTPEGDALDVLATLIDAYEAEHYPMDPPDRVRRDPLPDRPARSASLEERQEKTEN